MSNKKQYTILLFLALLLIAAIAAGMYRKYVTPQKESEASGSASYAGASREASADIASGDTASAGRVRILSREEFEGIKEQNTGIAFQASDLVWRDSVPACDEASASVYIPVDLQKLSSADKSRQEGELESPKSAEQSPEEEPENSISADKSPEEDPESFMAGLLEGLAPTGGEGTIYLCADEMMRDPEAAVAQGYAFEAFLASRDGAEEFHIFLTGLPALCIEKTDAEEIVRKEEHRGRISYIPAASSDEKAEYFCFFHVRGNVSAGFAKKPYKVTLTDKAGNKVKGVLGGLREDDDWILNPLFTDSTRVREMTAYTLWDKVSAFSAEPQPSSRMRYVEVFFDNSYQGIYGLMEPVDGKQLGLSEGDLLYKIDRWDREYPYLDEYEEKEGETEIYNDGGYPCVEIRYPKDWDNTATWLPMQAFHSFAIRTKDCETLKSAGLSADMDSILTMSLYCSMTHAMDSTWKNSFLIARSDGEGGYTLCRTIWDLNFVFGDVYIFKPKEGYTVFDARTASSYTPLQDSSYDYEAFLETDPSLEDEIKSKWADWRKGGISAESVCADAQQNLQLLKMSGAMEREMERWPQKQSCDDAFEQMQQWIRVRFAYLDSLYGLNTK